MGRKLGNRFSFLLSARQNSLFVSTRNERAPLAALGSQDSSTAGLVLYACELRLGIPKRNRFHSSAGYLLAMLSLTKQT